MSEPFYILAAAPTKPGKLKKIFESGPDSIMNLLQNPGQLRHAGWDLNTYDSPQIIKGEYLEVKDGRKLIRLYEDGTIILRALADNNYLGWGQFEEQFKKFPRLNSIALIELTYNFIDFYGRLSGHFESNPEKIRIRCELRNAFLTDSAKLILAPGPVGSVGYEGGFFKKEAPENNMSKQIDSELADIQNSPAYVVYELIKELYLWFGYTTDKIPYTSEDEQGKKFIDMKQITKEK